MTLPRRILLFVFVTGAGIMMVEIAASRMAAPYFGTSTIVWANIIGMVLGTLALGYFIGGRLADKYPTAKGLAIIALGAACFCLLIPFGGYFILQTSTGNIIETPLELIIRSFIGMMILFMPPVFLLAMASPYALRLCMADSASSGKTAGRLYAVSTLGSLTGTFLSSLVVIPILGVRAAFLLSAASLFAAATLISKEKILYLCLAGVLFSSTLLFFDQQKVSSDGVLFEDETFFQHVRVIEDSSGTRMLIYNEGGGVQSMRRPGDKIIPQSDYFAYYLTLLPLIESKEGAICIVGAAAGSIPRLMRAYGSRISSPEKLTITGIELDPDILPLGITYFGVEPGDADYIVADGRRFLASTDESYDLVITDAYSNQIYIPFHLASKEYMQLVNDRLKEGGIHALNVNATTEDSSLLQSFLLTCQSVYPHVYYSKVGGSYNYMIVASQRPLRPAGADKFSHESLQSVSQTLQKDWLEYYPDNTKGFVLTDNRAPVEFMTDKMVVDEIKQLF
jgi:spermidine synthase